MSSAGCWRRESAPTLAALLFGVVGLALGIPLLDGQPGPELTREGYVKLVAGGLLAIALAAALGVGYGTLIRHQVLAVVSVVVWFFILENLLHEVSADVHDYSIGAALTRLAQGGDPRMAMGDAGVVALAWTAAFLRRGRDRRQTARRRMTGRTPLNCAAPLPE